MTSATFSQYKFILLAVFSLTLLVTLTNAGYIGLRYGKRYNYNQETLGRLVPRSEGSGSRNIQVRSGARFYPGTRFGGKRSYWKPVASDLEDQQQFAAATALGGSSYYGNGSPYDCVYIPQVGVRCAGPDEENSYWTRKGNEISTDDENDPISVSSNNNNGDGDLTDAIVNPMSPSSSSSSSSAGARGRTLSGTRLVEQS